MVDFPECFASTAEPFDMAPYGNVVTRQWYYSHTLPVHRLGLLVMLLGWACSVAKIAGSYFSRPGLHLILSDKLHVYVTGQN